MSDDRIKEKVEKGLEELAKFNEKVGTDVAQDEPPVRSKRRHSPMAAPEEVEESGSGEQNSNRQNMSMWSQSSNRFFPCERAVDIVPAGQYIVHLDQYGTPFFETHNVDLDELMVLPDSASDEIIQAIESFWTKKEHYHKFGFLWKRGALLHGPPGSGKTSTLQILSKRIIDMNGISIYVTDPGIVACGLKTLRQIEPERPIVVMMEDLDALIRDNGEQGLLAMLDGETQIDNVVYIATTNYPERLDKRIINRPSRFDLIKYIGMPNEEARDEYINVKYPELDSTEREKWVKDAKGFSIAHIKELIVSVAILELDYRESLQRIRMMIDKEVISDENKTKPLGFTADAPDSA